MVNCESVAGKEKGGGGRGMVEKVTIRTRIWRAVLGEHRKIGGNEAERGGAEEFPAPHFYTPEHSIYTVSF